MPTIIKHTQNAFAEGHPNILTYAGDGGPKNRRYKAVDKWKGRPYDYTQQLDEYPYAYTLEGGEFASIMWVPADENII
jgi:hypothetical protein